MSTKEEIVSALEKIFSGKTVRIGEGRDAIFLQPADFGQKLYLTTLVYTGDGFIPLSVRKAASHPLEQSPLNNTWLSLDIDRFAITLHFVDPWIPTTSISLYELFAQFEETALRWREIFEEKDRQDLIYAHHLR